MTRASAEISKLRKQLREERRKRDKLLENLDAQREADIAAEQMIASLQQRLASGVPSTPGGGLGGAGPFSPSSLPSSLGGVGPGRPSYVQQLSTSLSGAAAVGVPRSSGGGSAARHSAAAAAATLPPQWAVNTPTARRRSIGAGGGDGRSAAQVLPFSDDTDAPQ